MQFPISLTVLAYLLIACDAIHSHHDNNQQAARDDWNHVLSPRVEVGDGDGITTTLFQVGDASVVGGCSALTSTIDAWLKEIVVLHNAIMTAFNTMNSGKKDIGLSALLMEIFGIYPTNTGGINKADKNSNTRWAAIQSRITQVQQFLNGGGLGNPASMGQTPWLFCSGKAATHVPWEQPVKDKHGNYVRPNPDSDYLTINQAFRGQNADGKNPFFLHQFNGYDFSPKGVNDPCDQGAFAYTANNPHYPEYSVIGSAATPIELAEFQPHILICDKAFNLGNEYHPAATLAQAVTAANYPNGNTGNDETYRLDKFVPLSATLYHELYHLADEMVTTADPYYKMVDVFAAGFDILNANANSQKAPDDPTTNPESYVFFAMAAYMYLNPPEGMTAVSFRAGLPRTVRQILTGTGG